MGNSKWTYQQLSELCEINLGKTPSRSKNEYWGEGHTWVSISDLKSKNIKNTKEEITDLALSDTNIRMVKKGTLLMSFKLSIGKLAFAAKDLYTNEAIVALPVKNGIELDKNYLYYVLGFIPLAGGNQAAMGKTLNKKSLAALSIPLPPTLADQKRIAKILSNCEALIQKRKDSIDLLDELLKSTFLEMFGDPSLNPKDFPIRKLSDFYSNPKTGTKCGPFGSALKKGEYVSKGIPVWNMDNISKSGVFQKKIKLWITEEKYDNLKGFATQNGDIIISRAGTVGKMCVLDSDYEKSIISTNLIRLRLNPSLLLPTYFVSLMNYCAGRVGRLKTGPDGGFTHMNTGILDKLEFPYPKIEFQERFSSIQDNVNQVRIQLEKSLLELQNLYGSLSQRAFKGELDLSKVDISAMEESKKKVETEVEDEKVMSEEEYSKQKAQIEEIISSEIEDASYLTESVLSYINHSKELRSIIYEKIKKKNLEIESLKEALSRLDILGKKIAEEVKEFTPWQIDQHRSIERYIPLLPESILDDFPNINQFSRNQFEYGSMSLDDYYGIPDEIIAQYGSIESHTMDLDFFFKKCFSNQFFTMKDVQDIYDKVVYEQGGWFKYEDMKEYIFKSLEGDDALLTQEFVEIEKMNPDLEKKEIIKQVMLKVLP